MNYHILLVEDNPSVIDAINDALEKEEFKLTVARDGQEAIEIFNRHSFDLVLLDLMLPYTSGDEVLRIIRRKSGTPVIIISMKNSDVEKAINLGLGADDYLTKPFSMIEMIARIKAVMRRAKQAHSITTIGEYKIKDIIVNFDDYTIYKKGVRIPLTIKEFTLFKILATNPEKVFSKDELFRLVWHEESYDKNNSINVHIKNLRDKIEDDSKNPEYVVTYWGFGYKIGQDVVKTNEMNKNE